MTAPSDEVSPDGAEASSTRVEKPQQVKQPKPDNEATLSVAAIAFGKALKSEFTRRSLALRGAVGPAWRWILLSVTDIAGRSRRHAHDLARRSQTAWSQLPSRWKPGSGVQSDPKERTYPRTWRILKVVAVTGAVAVGIGTVATAGVVIWAVRDLPLADILPPLEEPRLELVTADGETLYAQGAYRAAYVPLADLPQSLIEAVVAVEDRRFYSHGGIDLRAIARAAVANLRGGGISQGGSTITQQVVKVLYLSPERTFQRKLQEMVLAFALENQLGKDRILELYLNSIYLGSGAWGAPAAAEIYFGHGFSDLSLAEAATLAAGIRAPSQINLLADPETTRARAALVLRLMRAQDRIATDDILDTAEAELALLDATPPPSRAGSYYVDWVLKEAADLSQVVDGRITLSATIDAGLQSDAE
ncbi:MAG: penicillin-binding protein, partial [Rhodobacterales bacterium]|nr:penicillin-binding protein [Rhodobacterales bacterium]